MLIALNFLCKKYGINFINEWNSIDSTFNCYESVPFNILCIYK